MRGCCIIRHSFSFCFFLYPDTDKKCFCPGPQNCRGLYELRAKRINCTSTSQGNDDSEQCHVTHLMNYPPAGTCHVRRNHDMLLPVFSTWCRMQHVCNTERVQRSWFVVKTQKDTETGPASSFSTACLIFVAWHWIAGTKSAPPSKVKPTEVCRTMSSAGLFHDPPPGKIMLRMWKHLEEI